MREHTQWADCQAQALLLATDGTLPVGLCGVLRISARVRGVIAASKSLMSSLTSAALIFPSSDAVAGRNGTNFGTPPAICTVAGSAAQRERQQGEHSPAGDNRY